jgi:biotin carboxylase
MTMFNKKQARQIRAYMRNELKDPASDVWFQGYEVNCTRLAENAAWHFDCDHWLDDETHLVWDLAIEEGEKAERERLNPAR